MSTGTKTLIGSHTLPVESNHWWPEVLEIAFGSQWLRHSGTHVRVRFENECVLKYADVYYRRRNDDSIVIVEKRTTRLSQPRTGRAAHYNYVCINHARNWCISYVSCPVTFSVASEPRYWLGRVSPKWPILCLHWINLAPLRRLRERAWFVAMPNNDDWVLLATTLVVRVEQLSGVGGVCACVCRDNNLWTIWKTFTILVYPDVMYSVLH